jgi:uncharacterized protein YlxW (UPF0749 family)
MKPAIAIALAVVAFAGTAAFAAGPATQPQVAPTAQPLATTQNLTALDRKLNRLNARVTKLETRVKKLEKTNKLLVQVAVITLAGVACEATMTADAFQTTWHAVDEIAQATLSRTYFGPQVPLNDQKGCSDLSIARNAAAPLVPFQALIDLFYGP